MAKTLYQMVYETVKKEIDNGTFKEGEVIPSEKELAQRFYTSRITIQRAMNMLAREGYVKRTPGCGTSVQKKETAKAMNTVGIILSHISTDFGVNMLSSIEQYCTEKNINMLFKNSLDSSEAEIQAIRSLLASNVAGILIQPNHVRYYNEELLRLSLQKYPLVFLDRPLKGLAFPCVSTDNFKAANEAAKKLFDAGHRNICLLSFDPRTASTLEDRLNGFKQAFIDCHVMCTDRNLLTLCYDHESSREHNEEILIGKIKQYLKKCPQTTAVLSTEVYCAQLLYRAVDELGLHIPEDLSLICFDYVNQPFGTRITHIAQDQRQIGATAIRLLLDIIRGNQTAENVFVPHKIVDGDTVTAPKKSPKE